jgi:hypothetical protein
VERAARHGRALSPILCDIDLFKSINDSLVHAGGGQVLKQFGARLHSCAEASPSLPAPACAGLDRVPAASELPCTLAFASAAVGENALSTTQALAWPGVCGRRAPSVHMVMHKFCG